ncbi:MAG: hypothetical protein ABIP85_22710 [Chthoniobacteraceae bacterium]
MNIPTIDQLKRGVAITEQIAALERELMGIFGNHAAAPAPVAKSAPAQADGRKGKRSAETIARMKAAQKKRWAKVNGGEKAPAKARAAASVKRKRTMVPAVKAKLAAAMKARWAMAKAGKGPAPTAKKK